VGLILMTIRQGFVAVIAECWCSFAKAARFARQIGLNVEIIVLIMEFLEEHSIVY
jgi:hypothetical protein